MWKIKNVKSYKDFEIENGDIYSIKVKRFNMLKWTVRLCHTGKTVHEKKTNTEWGAFEYARRVMEDPEKYEKEAIEEERESKTMSELYIIERFSLEDSDAAH